MARVQLALNVRCLEQAVDFYTKLFGTEPAKVRPGYANFAVADPPLKLVLIQNPDAADGSLDHLGVEVGTPGDVAAAHARLAAEGLVAATEDQATCCYAVQDKVWVDGPGGHPWEVYAVLADAAGPHAEGPDAAGPEAAGLEAAVRSVGPGAAACCAGLR
ncbi:MAG TPA: ArsI/CadI family heavy metal resistance metalloenzyme [Acidimicrobiales bacterium]|nr:ArsI/CadI family heavy metal resistance metalloenzyme [Acidimicrobiales bacterium]